MSVPPSFTLFNQLPLEIQDHIWRYAATPTGVLEFYDLLLDLFGADTTWTPEKIFFFYTAESRISWEAKPSCRDSAPEIAAARDDLMATCKASRLVALKAWRKDLARIEYRQRRVDLERHFVVGRAKVLGVLDEFME